MLWADKQAAETDLHQQLAQLRERELNFQIHRYNQLGVVSSVLIGVVSTVMQTQSACERSDRDKDTATVLIHVFFEVLCVVSLGAFTTVNVAALMLSVLAPRLALHGPPGSVGRAVDALHHHGATTGAAFAGGLVAFFATLALHPWIYFSAAVSLPVSLAVLATMVVAIYMVRSTQSHRRFSFR